MTTIDIRNLAVPLGEDRVRTLSIVVGSGESVALVGHDQRRLTPIIRQCGGLDPIASGSVHVGEVDIGHADHRALLRLRGQVGYVSVGGGLFANLSLLDNIALPLRYHRVEDPEGRARELLGRASLEDLAAERAATVSTELQKLVAYLRALALRPSVLLVEDPAAHLSPQGRAVVESLHAQLRERNATVLIADDDRELASRLASRLVDLDAVPEAA